MARCASMVKFHMESEASFSVGSRLRPSQTVGGNPTIGLRQENIPLDISHTGQATANPHPTKHQPPQKFLRKGTSPKFNISDIWTFLP